MWQTLRRALPWADAYRYRAQLRQTAAIMWQALWHMTICTPELRCRPCWCACTVTGTAASTAGRHSRCGLSTGALEQQAQVQLASGHLSMRWLPAGMLEQQAQVQTKKQEPAPSH